MQGSNETDARALPPGAMPAHRARLFYRRYARSLLVFTMPAMVAGMLTGMMIAEPQRDAYHGYDLAQRADMLRSEQAKILDTHLTRISAVRASASDVDLATR